MRNICCALCKNLDVSNFDSLGFLRAAECRAEPPVTLLPVQNQPSKSPWPYVQWDDHCEKFEARQAIK